MGLLGFAAVICTGDIVQTIESAPVPIITDISSELKPTQAPTETPTPRSTNTPRPTKTEAPIGGPVYPTSTPTIEPSPTPPETFTPEPTLTPTPVPTETPIPFTPTLEPTIALPTWTPEPPPPTATETPPPPPPTATEVPPPPETPPMIAGQIPTLEQIANCPAGVFPEAPGLPQWAVDNGQAFGLIMQKDVGGPLLVQVQQVLNNEMISMNLSEVVRLNIRQIIDRSRYPLYNNSWTQVVAPYTINQAYQYLSIGSHVWVFGNPGQRVLMIYCDAVQ